MNALMVAAREGHPDAVENLISAGADINKANNDGLTALMLADIKGHRDIVITLTIEFIKKL